LTKFSTVIGALALLSSISMGPKEVSMTIISTSVCWRGRNSISAAVRKIEPPKRNIKKMEIIVFLLNFMGI